MKEDALSIFARSVEPIFAQLSAPLVSHVRAALECLVTAPPSEAWLSTLHAEGAAATELIRDAHHGYLLLAHTEHAGLYRPPHDHGRGWVIYALQRGEMEVTTYARVEDEHGRVRVEKRESSTLRAGEARAYWPGDIHDTRCVVGPSLLFRFTDRDLKKEDLEARRVTRYAAPGGACTQSLS